jgi:hypothetical protein
MDALDVYGDQLFGRRIRLRVLLWADRQKQAFNQSEASKGVDYSSSGEVAKELERLVRLGMLRKFGRPARVGPQNYVRVEHPGWAIASAARAAVNAGLKDEGDPHEDEPRSLRERGRPGAAARLVDGRGEDRTR